MNQTDEHPQIDNSIRQIANDGITRVADELVPIRQGDPPRLNDARQPVATVRAVRRIIGFLVIRGSWAVTG